MTPHRIMSYSKNYVTEVAHIISLYAPPSAMTIDCIVFVMRWKWVIRMDALDTVLADEYCDDGDRCSES